jgi:hypothetical protein
MGVEAIVRIVNRYLAEHRRLFVAEPNLLTTCAEPRKSSLRSAGRARTRALAEEVPN